MSLKLLFARSRSSTALITVMLLALLPCSAADFAWQNEDTYQPPDFERVFPENPEAGKRLQQFLRSLAPNSVPPDDTFEIFRLGLRTLSIDQQMPALRWFGNQYIWNKSPQNARAIELMYHAAGSSNSIISYNAIYFGLSVVRPLTEPILRALVEAAMKSEDPNVLSRIAWGAASRKERLQHYLQPFLESAHDARREHAQVLQKIFSGELKAFAWPEENARDRARDNYAPHLEEFRSSLLGGDSAARLKTLELFQKERIALIMDDGFLPAFAAAASDTNSKIRDRIAVTVGSRWIWHATNQHPDAIDLMLRLSKDIDRQVRYNANYYGLSTIRNRSDAVIERMLELTLKDGIDDENFRQRIVWGLKNDAPALRRVLEKWMRRSGSNKVKAVFAYGFHLDFYSEAPAANDQLVELINAPGKTIAHLIAIGPTAGWKVDSIEGFLVALGQELPPEHFARLLWTNNQGPPFLIVEEHELPAVKDLLLKSPRFKIILEKSIPLEVILQLGKTGRLELNEN